MVGEKRKFKEIEFDWNKELSVRIIVIGPSFNQDVKKLANKVKYQIDLIQLKKFVDNNEEYILVNQKRRARKIALQGISIRHIGEYDEAFYKSNFNPNSVRGFLKVADMMEKYVNSMGWELTRRNNYNYISFKHNNRIVCGVYWLGSKVFRFFHNIKKRE